METRRLAARRLPVKKMNGEDNSITVFIVAASFITRAGFESVLREKGEFIIAGGAAELPSAPPASPFEQLADVILMSIERQKDFDELLNFLRDGEEEFESPPLVALFSAEMQNSDYPARVLRSGARGILPPDATSGEIIAAVAAAANDLIALPPEIIEYLLAAANDNSRVPIPGSRDGFADEMIENLTPRETEVLTLLADGASNKAIADELNISEHTVKFHVASIFGKFGVNTRTEAVTQALRRGLILL